MARAPKNVEANKAKAKEWREANKDRLRAYMAVWRDTHREHMREQAARWRAANPKRWRNRVLMQKYGITQRDYLDMVIGQAGRCLVCGKVPTDDLVVDHNHDTGKVRGLLCQRCNRMLGHVDESADVLRSAIRYLEVAG